MSPPRGTNIIKEWSILDDLKKRFVEICAMGNAFETCPLAVMTHLADMEATYLVERKATK